jgi:hypothetical protein
VIWRFPKIGLAPNHPFIDGFPINCKPSGYWGTPVPGNPHTMSMKKCHGYIINIPFIPLIISYQYPMDIPLPLVNKQFAIENGHRKFVSFPINSMVVFHSYMPLIYHEKNHLYH